MSYVTVLWSTAAAAALLLAVMHALVWIYDRRALAHLAFAFSALGLAGGTITELGMMYAQTPQEWGEWVWWTHLPLFVIVIAMSIFMHLYLSAGRRWLLAALIAARAIVLLINLGSDPNINFESIHAIERIPFLGEEVSVASRVVTGKYQWFALLTSLLFPAFIIDVVVTLWRRGTPDARRVAMLVGGPVLLSVAISVAMTQLVIWDILELPMLLIPPFLLALAAMMLEVSRNMLRASRLAHELHESEQRLQLAAKAAGVGLWSWDATSGRVWMTEQSRAILGLPKTGEVDAATLLRIANPNDAPDLRATLQRALDRGGEHSARFRIGVPGGSSRWIAAQGTVETAPDGQPQLIRGVVLDVTRQHVAEEEANELRRKLSHVGRVTMLGELSSSLAHELSQPLTAIQHNAQTAELLLEREPVDLPELRAIVTDVLRDNLRAVEVVQRMREWLKQGRLHSEALCVNDLTRDVLALVRADAAEKRVTLECNMSDALPPVAGDRVHLSQVLLNLIMNAIDAVAGSNGPRRHVVVAARVVADRYCELSVSDSGPGVPPNRLAQIFEPFFTDKADGVGIGLSISRTIVEAHGGKLWAENGDDGGATFRFTVPLYAAEVARSA